MTLTHRERFMRLFNGEPVDRVPFLDIMGFWPSSLARWKTEGLDPDATVQTVRDLIGFDGHRGYKLPIRGFIWPEFEREVLAEDIGSILVRNRWGALERNLPGLDHGVPNDVSWDDYRYFYERLRELIWRYPPASI